MKIHVKPQWQESGNTLKEKQTRQDQVETLPEINKYNVMILGSIPTEITLVDIKKTYCPLSRTGSLNSSTVIKNTNSGSNW